jgi:hypothetical protein
MLTLHSHTHCQVAQADTQAKTWQRVCLSNLTTDRKTNEEKEALGGNMRYKTLGFSRLCKLPAPHQSSLSGDSDVARNPQRFHTADR